MMTAVAGCLKPLVLSLDVALGTRDGLVFPL